jgi:bifunctional ADP-heptose synthase (sugar kinase/adenylyltransferase)
MTPVTVLGDDGQAYDLLRALSAMPVDPSHIVRDPARLTPTYTKPLRRAPKGGWAEFNRLDLRNCAPLSEQTEAKLLAELTTVFDATDGLIVLDQVNEEGWGVVGPAVREHLNHLAARSPEKLIFIDSRAHIARFRCGTLKPNVHECLAALGAASKQGVPDAVPSIEVAMHAAKRFAQQTGCPLYCTMSERGMLVVEGEGEATLAPGYPVSGPIDPVGAGDSATAGIVSALLAGANRVEAAAVGNLTASITVQQLGTTGTATPEQLIARWREAHV